MGKFDAEKKEAGELVAKLKAVLPQAKQHSANCTATVRTYISRVEKNDAKLEAIAKEASDRLRYLGDVEKSVGRLEGMLKDAHALTEEAAEKIVKEKSWGNLVHFAPGGGAAKAKVIAGVEAAIENELKRGQSIIEGARALVEAWESRARKHFVACELARELGAVALE